jgi:hypothetical protein
MKTIMKKTETSVIIKISGTDVAETITLATDLLATTEVIQGTPTAPIAFIQYTIDKPEAAKVVITRGGVAVIGLYNPDGFLDFAGNGGFLEKTGQTSDIVVTITGTAFVYITLRKTAGYKSKIEPEFFGQYDNPNAVGS